MLGMQPMFRRCPPSSLSFRQWRSSDRAALRGSGDIAARARANDDDVEFIHRCLIRVEVS